MHLFRLFERQIKACMLLGYLSMLGGLGWTIRHPVTRPAAVPTMPAAGPAMLDDDTVARQNRPALRPARPARPPLPQTRNQSRADRLSARQA